MIVGCYSLDLYCDVDAPRAYASETAHAHAEFPHSFTGPSGRGCRAEAKRRGWKLRGRIAICPKCAKAGRKRKGSQ